MRILTLIFALLLIMNVTVPAQSPETLTIRLGTSKTADEGKVKVTFVSIVEDSRCPVGATCIWAGNAKIKIAVSKGKAVAKTVELNTGAEPRTVSIYGYTIKLEELVPRPGEHVKMIARPEMATLSITRSGM